MSRPLRITYPGAIYHIINRGSRRDKIFKRIGDRIEFLERLQASLEKYNGILFGYCLMDNHFHLLIQTLEPNISDIMQTLQGGYANWFRFKHRLVGPLFQSRFKSVLVEDESYLVTLSSYIHLNPVRAGIVENPEDYRWSSAEVYLKSKESDLVETKRVLHHSGGLENYRYILSEMIDDPPEYEAVYGKFSILGDKAFKDKVVRQNYNGYLEKIDMVEIPELKFLTVKSPDKIKEIVLKHFNIQEKELLRSSRNNIPRKLFLHLLKKYSRLKLSEIADFTGTLPNSCGSLIIKFRNEIKQSKELKKLVDGMEEQLINETS